jgi:hypothetical protein
MARRDTSTATEGSPSAAGSAIATGDQKVVKLEPLPKRFDDRVMQRHNRLLGTAAAAMNSAFETSYAIGVIADMLAANEVAKDCDENLLLPNQEGALLSAISVMAHSLNSYLCDKASYFGTQLREQEGGAQ